MNPAQLKKMMMEAQKMQADIEKKQKKLDKQEFSKNAAGGVSIVMNGKKELLKLEIKDELLDPEDKDFLEDLIIGAINDLTKEIDAKYDEIIGGLTKGMPF